MNQKPDQLLSHLKDTMARQVEKVPTQPLTDSRRTGSPNIKLTAADDVRISEIVAYAISMKQRLTVADVFRLALHNWNFKTLTSVQISEMRKRDLRRKKSP